MICHEKSDRLLLSSEIRDSVKTFVDVENKKLLEGSQGVVFGLSLRVMKRSCESQASYCLDVQLATEWKGYPS